MSYVGCPPAGPREMKRAGGDTIQWDNKEMKQKEQLIAGLSGAAPACAALHFLSVKTRAAPVSAAILHTWRLIGIMRSM